LLSLLVFINDRSHCIGKHKTNQSKKQNHHGSIGMIVQWDKG
jgi:hypothetical protein